MTLCTPSGRTLLKPHSNHYKNQKDMFVRVMGEITLPWSQLRRMMPLTFV